MIKNPSHLPLPSHLLPLSLSCYIVSIVVRFIPTALPSAISRREGRGARCECVRMWRNDLPFTYFMTSGLGPPNSLKSPPSSTCFRQYFILRGNAFRMTVKYDNWHVCLLDFPVFPLSGGCLEPPYCDLLYLFRHSRTQTTTRVTDITRQNRQNLLI